MAIKTSLTEASHKRLDEHRRRARSAVAGVVLDPMNQQIAGTLDEAAIKAFLENQSTGSLALADQNDSYAIPVGFTFVPETKDFYFRLSYGVESRKRAYIETTDRATFVVAAETESGWKSVVASGELEHRKTPEKLEEMGGTEYSPDESHDDAKHEWHIPFYRDIGRAPRGLTPRVNAV